MENHGVRSRALSWQFSRCCQGSAPRGLKLAEMSQAFSGPVYLPVYVTRTSFSLILSTFACIPKTFFYRPRGVSGRFEPTWATRESRESFAT